MSKSRSRKLRIGVAGLGRIGWLFHCKTLGSHRDWQLVAVADPDPQRRLEAEQTHHCRPFERFEDMLEQADLDAVTIATPTHLHKQHALAAIKGGLHVMLEKPMAPSLTDARAIVRAAERAHRVLTVYQPHRAAAYFQHLGRIIESGRIGEVYHIRRGSFRFVRRDDWQSLTKFGGGMLNNYGAHGLDQVLALTGYDVKKVFCNLRRVASLGDAEDVVKIVYQTRSGVIGEVDINQATVHTPYDIEVYGTRGVITKNKNEFTIRYLSPKDLKTKTLDTRLASADRKYPDDDIRCRQEVVQVDPELQVDVYKDFARAIRTAGTPFVPPEQTLEVMRIMDRCRKDSNRITQTPLT
jgi:scyllo-inositol 2-dehydrogenase (NADP+)